MSTVIFDIDNCLADDTHRLHLIDKSQENADECYRKYHEKMMLDTAHNHHMIKAHVNAGDKIIFVTARPEEYRARTWSWLSINFDFREDTQLWMRPIGNRMPSAELKNELVTSAFDSPRDTIAYDDKQSVVDMYNRIGIKAYRLAIRREVPDILMEAAKTFAERNKVYGSAYKRHGHVMAAMLPDGLSLKTVDDWNKFGVFSMIVSKMVRYSTNMNHKDSAHDLSVYAAMLEELTK